MALVIGRTAWVHGRPRSRQRAGTSVLATSRSSAAIRRARQRRALAIGLLGVTLLVCWRALPARHAATPAPGRGSAARAAGDGHDALGLRLGLLCFVGLALAGGAYVQYRSLVRPRPGWPPTSQRRDPAIATESDAAADTGPSDDRELRFDWDSERSGRDADRLAYRPERSNVAAGYSWQHVTGHEADALPERPMSLRAAPPVQAAVAPAERPQVPGEAECARAIAAACRYDRHGTIAGFRAALAANAALNASAVAGFWEMPSSGHADLSRVYRECGKSIDARSVLTVAMMLFPHNRELEALAREESSPERPARWQD